MIEVDYMSTRENTREPERQVMAWYNEETSIRDL